LSERRADSIASALVWVSIAVLAAAWLSATVAPGYALFRWIPNGYNEGWNAYWAQVAWSGGPLYPAIDSPISNNYPPLSFYIVGGLGRLLGDNIFAGRLLALVSLVVIAADIFIWLRSARFSPRDQSSPSTQFSRSSAALAALLFLAAFAQYAPAYIAMNDPQLLAHAIVMTAAVLLWRYDFSRNALLAAALLMVVGGLIKHLLIALPLATTAWIAIYRRQQLALWLLVSLSAVAAAIALVYLTQGAVFFHDMASSRLYSRLLIQAGVGRVWQSFGFVLILGAAALPACISRFSNRALGEQAAFALLYLALAGVIGALAAGGKGVDRNAFFDLLIAVCLAVAVGVEYLRQRPSVNPLVSALIAVSCCTVFLIQAANQWPSRWQRIQQTDIREAEVVRVIEAIRTLGGGATACEELSLCYWAGSAFKVDFFNYGQKLATSALPAGNCAETFSAELIALIQLNPPRPGDRRLSWRLPQECNDAIARVYSPVAASPHSRLMRPAADLVQADRPGAVLTAAVRRQCACQAVRRNCQASAAYAIPAGNSIDKSIARNTRATARPSAGATCASESATTWAPSATPMPAGMGMN
jgi:hypothetical protein